MLAVAGQALRWDRPPVVGEVFEVTRLGQQGPVVLDGQSVGAEEALRCTPATRDGIVITVPGVGGDRLVYRVPVMEKVEVTLVPASGPAAVVRDAAPFVCTLTNRSREKVLIALEVWTPPEMHLSICESPAGTR